MSSSVWGEVGPRLRCVTKNSLHNEGTNKCVNSAPFFLIATIYWAEEQQFSWVIAPWWIFIFHLAKWFPTTPSTIQPIGTPSTFCIVWHLVSQSLDVAIFVVLHLNVLWTTYNPQQFTKISVFKVDNFVRPSFFSTELKSVAQIEWKKHPYIFFLLLVQKWTNLSRKKIGNQRKNSKSL